MPAPDPKPTDHPRGASQAASVPQPTEDVRRAVEEALDHADDLLDAASCIRERHPHLAYHLGVLALEEVGRSTLTVVQHVARGGGQAGRRLKDSDDHVRKLFWALWGPSFGRQKITGAQIEEMQGLARAIHDTRKAALYYRGPDQPAPRETVSGAKLDNLLKVATARLGMARAERLTEIDENRAADFAWFIEITADPGERAEIMSNRSMEKLVELGSTPAWIRWLRTESERAERAALARAERELTRTAPPAEEEDEPKWRLKCRLETTSHSVRGKDLNWWNDNVDWLKLRHAKSQELIAEIVLPKRVPVHSVWNLGWLFVQRLVLALNIGTGGFFWFGMPEKVAEFYEELTDLESNSRLKVSRRPALRIDWGNEILSEARLAQVAACLGWLPAPEERARSVAFVHYFNGLALLAKTDVTIQFQINAFEAFYVALRETARSYGGWKGDSHFGVELDRILERYGVAEGRTELKASADLIDAVETSDVQVDLSEVAGLKVITDAFILEQVRRDLNAVPPNPDD